MILRKLDFHYHIWKTPTRISDKVYETDPAFNAGQLTVYLNGLKVKNGSDYTEISDTRIEFTYVIDVNDIVSFEYIKKSIFI